MAPKKAAGAKVKATKARKEVELQTEADDVYDFEPMHEEVSLDEIHLRAENAASGLNVGKGKGKKGATAKKAKAPPAAPASASSDEVDIEEDDEVEMVSPKRKGDSAQAGVSNAKKKKEEKVEETNLEKPSKKKDGRKMKTEPEQSDTQISSGSKGRVKSKGRNVGSPKRMEEGSEEVDSETEPSSSDRNVDSSGDVNRNDEEPETKPTKKGNGRGRPRKETASSALKEVSNSRKGSTEPSRTNPGRTCKMTPEIQPSKISGGNQKKRSPVSRKNHKENSAKPKSEEKADDSNSGSSEDEGIDETIELRKVAPSKANKVETVGKQAAAKGRKRN